MEIHENAECLINVINENGKTYAKNTDCNWDWVVTELEHIEHGIQNISLYHDPAKLTNCVTPEAKDMLNDYMAYVGGDIDKKEFSEIAQKLQYGTDR